MSSFDIAAVRMLALAALAPHLSPEVMEAQGVPPITGMNPADLACEILLPKSQSVFTSDAFGVGFDLGLELGARIALNPLERVDLYALLQVLRKKVEDAEEYKRADARL